MGSKTRTYYRVKPEFDQYTLIFKFDDKRYKNNFRIENKTIIAGELFTTDKYIKMIRSKTYDISDMFTKVKCKSFISFGCRFEESYEFDYSLLDLMRDRRKKLLTQFIHIYENYCRIVEGRRMLLSQRLYCNYLSIETLEFLIRYYGDLIHYKTFMQNE